MDSRCVGIIALVALATFALLLPAESDPSDVTSATAASAQTLSTVPAFSPDIRVNLTPADVAEITIKIDGPYLIRPVDSQIVLARGPRLGTSSITRTAQGMRIGAAEFPVTRIEVESSNSPSIWVNSHQYRGRVRLFGRRGGKLIAVNVLPLEQYLASVVDSEMPASFPVSARRAQAIVARTYALDQMQHRPQRVPFDVYATTRSQNYLGFKYRSNDGRLLAGETLDGRKAVADTSGMVCLHNSRIFRTYYSAVCGGRTTQGSQVFSDAAAPLASVPCQWCREARLYRWTAELSKSELTEVVASHFKIGKQQIGRLITVSTGYQKPSTTVATFEFDDGRQKKDVSATTLRRLFPGKLHSPRFSILADGDKLIVSGQGHGHGVGLCQWGARGLALANHNYLQIVQYYYPGSEIVTLTDNRR